MQPIAFLWIWLAFAVDRIGALRDQVDGGPTEEQSHFEADAEVDDEFRRLAYSEASRYGSAGMWQVTTPEGTFTPRCSPAEAQSSERCGEAVVGSLAEHIQKLSSAVENASVKELAERTSWACGQGMTNDWYVKHQGMFGYNAKAQHCSVQILPVADSAPRILVIGRAIYREGTCKNSFFHALSSKCQRWKVCLLTEVARSGPKPYLPTAYFVRRTRADNILDAFAHAKGKKMSDELHRCYS